MKILALALFCALLACNPRRCLREHTEWQPMVTTIIVGTGQVMPIVQLIPVDVCDEYAPEPAR